MSWMAMNLSIKCCAFCKYWWDPACRHIQPQQGIIWQMESNAVCRCIKRNMDTRGDASCGMFRYKNVLGDL